MWLALEESALFNVLVVDGGFDWFEKRLLAILLQGAEVVHALDWFGAVVDHDGDVSLEFGEGQVALEGKLGGQTER